MKVLIVDDGNNKDNIQTVLKQLQKVFKNKNNVIFCKIKENENRHIINILTKECNETNTLPIL